MSSLVFARVANICLTTHVKGISKKKKKKMADIWAVPLAQTDFNIVVSFLGAFVSLFGLVSYLLKENYYLSEARESHMHPLFTL